jgi:hypothetical protein
VRGPLPRVKAIEAPSGDQRASLSSQHVPAHVEIA